jgi:hypothetical protein
MLGKQASSWHRMSTPVGSCRTLGGLNVAESRPGKTHDLSHAFQYTKKLTILVLVSCLAACSRGAAEQRVPLYGVHEVVFDGPRCGAGEAPARDVELVTQWRHESGSPTCAILGFWDGDGHGGTAGADFEALQAAGAS